MNEPEKCGECGRELKDEEWRMRAHSGECWICEDCAGLRRNETQTNLLNGLPSNCAAFDKWLQAWFSTHKTEDEDQWWHRDMLAAAWDAGVRAALGLTPTPEEMRAHADAVDKCNERRQDAEVARLKELCLEAAGYIGVRQGPELDAEADSLMRRLRGEM